MRDCRRGQHAAIGPYKHKKTEVTVAHLVSEPARKMNSYRSGGARTWLIDAAHDHGDVVELATREPQSVAPRFLLQPHEHEKECLGQRLVTRCYGGPDTSVGP